MFDDSSLRYVNATFPVEMPHEAEKESASAKGRQKEARVQPDVALAGRRVNRFRTDSSRRRQGQADQPREDDANWLAREPGRELPGISTLGLHAALANVVKHFCSESGGDFR